MPNTNRHLPLTIKNLEYRHHRSTLIKQINLHVDSNGNSIILGHNGAGKSLLLKLLHGVINPTSGKIEWNGSIPASNQYWRTLLLQKPTFFQRSVQYNLEFVLHVAGMPVAQRKDLLQQALDICGLTDLAEHNANSLSGGQQQRLSLARAWVLQPDVLLLDEPTVALDPPASQVFENILYQFKQSHTKVLMTTHDLAQAKRLADEIIFMDKGEVLEQRDATEFFSAPDSVAAQNFLQGKLA